MMVQNVRCLEVSEQNTEHPLVVDVCHTLDYFRIFLAYEVS